MTPNKTTEQPIPGYFMKWVDGFAADTRQRNLPTSFLMQEVAIATYRHLHSIGDARILDRQEYSKWIRKTIEDELSDGNRESLAERLAFEFDAHVTCVYEGGEEWKSLYENLKAKAHSLPPSPVETRVSVTAYWEEERQRLWYFWDKINNFVDQLWNDGIVNGKVDDKYVKRVCEVQAAGYKELSKYQNPYDHPTTEAAPSPVGEAGDDFQSKVAEWVVACFGEAIAMNKVERNFRFLEEALELVQANGCSKTDALALVDYVYGRPIGEIKQECGGVMVTLASLAKACEISMEECGNTELARVWGKIEQIRIKQAAKKIVAGPLP